MTKVNFLTTVESALKWGESDKGTERKSSGTSAQEEVEHANRRMRKDVAKIAPARLEYTRVISECTREMPQSCLKTLQQIII